MTSRTTTMKPGLLVSLKTTVSGGIQYERVQLDHKREGETEVDRWETQRTIEDVAQWEATKRVRSQAAHLIRRVCITTNFGLLCPIERADELDEAIAEAQKMADEHNATSSITDIGVYVIKGRIADNDEEAMRAVASEVTGLLETMKRGVEELDVKAVRRAASDAKRIGAMLDSAKDEKVQAAVKAVRATARAIVKQGETNMTAAMKAIVDEARDPIEMARIAFLDLDFDGPDDGAGEDAPDRLPEIDTGRVAGIDVGEGETENETEGGTERGAEIDVVA